MDPQTIEITAKVIFTAIIVALLQSIRKKP